MISFEQEVTHCANVISEGGVLLYPTDTIWGLGCDATNEEAIEKIFRIKRRPAQKSLIVLITEERDIYQYVAAPPPEIFEKLALFKRPTTLIFDHGLGLASQTMHENGSVALRITQDAFCRAIIKRTKRPLVSTSANISGQSFRGSFKDVPELIVNEVDYAVHYRREEIINSRPSDIFKVLADGTLQSLR